VEGGSKMKSPENFMIPTRLARKVNVVVEMKYMKEREWLQKQ
jgi:hypothetical protein